MSMNITKIRRFIRLVTSWICCLILMNRWIVWWKRVEKRMSWRYLNARCSEILLSLSGISTLASFIILELLFILFTCWHLISMFSSSYNKTTIPLARTAHSPWKTKRSSMPLTPSVTSSTSSSWFVSSILWSTTWPNFSSKNRSTSWTNGTTSISFISGLVFSIAFYR